MSAKAIIREANLHCHDTPTDWLDSGAVKLHISPAKLRELAAIPRGEEHIKRGIVAFDHISRKWYAIRNFPCFTDSFDCCCAAQAKALTGPDEKHEWDDIEFPSEEDDDKCPCCGEAQ